MKNILLASGLVFTVFSSLIVGCGSDVTNMNSSDSSSSSSSSSSASSSSSSSSSGGSDAFQACVDMCHKLDALNCNPGMGACEATLCTGGIDHTPTQCSEVMASYFTCVKENASNCDPPPACANQGTAVADCQMMYECAETCENTTMNGQTTCSCGEVCGGSIYSITCTTPANGTMSTCDCIQDGMSVGMCDQQADVSCGLATSCCNTMFFNL